MRRIYALLITVLILSLSISSAYAAGGYHRPSLYADVKGDFWAYDAIEYASDRQWFNGYSDGTFLPDNTMTRAEAIKVFAVYLYRDIKNVTASSFTDVNPAEWYAPYVEAGSDLLHDVQKGGSFRPDEPITREAAVYVLVRYLDLNRKVKYVDMSTVDKFTDGHKLTAELKPYLAMALQTSLISGYSDNTIRPKNPLTRAEFATLLYRATLMKEDNKKFDISTEEEFEKVENEKINLLGISVDAGGNYQKQVVDLVNNIRQANGLSILKINNDLTYLAQLKAEDMNVNNYFEHESPIYGSPFDMLENHGVYYERAAGENIAKGQNTANDVVNSWMNSEGHKKNILKESYKEIGIGYVPGKNIWVQIFIG